MSEAKDKKTLEDRIKELMVKYNIEEQKEEFVRLTMELVERGASPQNFCPECDYRLIYDINTMFMKCVNCGYSISSRDMVSKTGQQPRQSAAPQPLPPGMEKLINESGEEVKKKRESIAKKINRLRGQSDGTSASEADESIVRSQDPAIKGDINWC